MYHMNIRVFYGWWIVGACFLVALYVSTTIFFGFTAFIEPLIEEFGWSYTQVSFAASLRGLEMGILAPFIGYFVDRLGSRKVMIFGAVTVGLGLITLGCTRSLLTFYAAMVLVAFGAGGCTSVVTMTVLAQWFRRHLGKATGIMSSGFGASGLCIPLVVLLVDTCGWRTALILLGFGMWLLGIPLALVMRDHPETYGYLPDGDRHPPGTITSAAADDAEVPFSQVIRDRAFRYLALAEAIRFMGLTAVVVHIMPYLSTMGVSRITAGLVAGAIPLTSIAGRLAFGWLGDIFEQRYVMMAAFLSMGAGMFMLAHFTGSMLSYCFLIPFSAGFGGITVLRVTMLRAYFGRNGFGKMIGIIMGCASIGGVIGPTLAGWIFDTVGTYHLLWLWFSGSIFLAILLIFLMKKPLPSGTTGDDVPCVKKA